MDFNDVPPMKYKHKTRLGNWNEEMILEEQKYRFAQFPKRESSIMFLGFMITIKKVLMVCSKRINRSIDNTCLCGRVR